MNTVAENMTAQDPGLEARKTFTSRWFIISGISVLLLLVIGLVWWLNRPIRPVILSEPAREKLDHKLAAVTSPERHSSVEEHQEPSYEPGKRELTLSERELNALLHQKTDLGDRLHLELATDAVHARAEFDLPHDFPIVGGRKMKLKARFRTQDVAGNPALIAEDVTAWGISIPNDWLGGLKGQNLLEILLGAGAAHATGGFPGIEKLEVKPGSLLLKLAE